MRAIRLLSAWAILMSLGVTAADATTLHVAPGGSHAGAGTAASPFGAIQAALGRAVPGDEVVVEAGVYQESVFVSRGGEAGRPLVIRGEAGAVLESPNPAASLSAFDVQDGVGHLRVEGLEVRGGFAEAIMLRPGSHDIALARLSIHGNRNGIWVNGARDVQVDGVEVSENGRAAIRLYNGASGIVLRDSVTRDNDDGLGCAGDADGISADETVSDVRLERVVAEGNSEDGIDLKARELAIYQSVSRNNGCSGVKLWNSSYLENVLVEGNKTGITISGPPATNITLHSLTAVANAIGIRADGSDLTLAVYNSIVTGPGKALSLGAHVDLVEDYNILFRPEPGTLIERRLPEGDEIFTPGDVVDGRWFATSGQGAHTLAANPLLTDDSDHCFPAADSPALDSGMTLGTPAIDLTGMVRPSGGGVDRGAYERPANLLPLERLRMHTRIRGGGRDRLSIQGRLPAPTGAIDPTMANIVIAVRRGDRTVLRVDSAVAARQSMAAGSVVLSLGSAPAGRLVLRSTRDGLVVALRARELDLGSGGEPLTVEVHIGTMEGEGSFSLDGRCRGSE